MPNFIYPPVPKGKITSGELNRYELSENYVCQRKFNGTHNVIKINKLNNEVFMFTRLGASNKQFSMSPELKSDFLNLNLGNGEYWLDGELLEAKTKNYKGKVVLYDVLWAEKDFFGEKLLTRLEILNKICRNPQETEEHLKELNRKYTGIALKVTDNIWMVQTWENNFLERYKDFIDQDEIEGLVLKRKNSFLDNSGNKMYDCDWILRCRKSTKNYKY